MYKDMTIAQLEQAAWVLMADVNATPEMEDDLAEIRGWITEREPDHKYAFTQAEMKRGEDDN